MEFCKLFFYIITIALSNHYLTCMNNGNTLDTNTPEPNVYNSLFFSEEDSEEEESAITALNDLKFFSFEAEEIPTNNRQSSDEAFKTCVECLKQDNVYYSIGLFLQKDLDLNSQDSDGNTLLNLLACKENPSPGMFQLLLNNKANPNIANNEGHAPLHTLTFKKDISCDIVSLFLKNKADINIKNKNGDTPFHVVCLSAHRLHLPKNIFSDLIKLFIKKKANITIQNNDGDTGLHSLCKNKELSLDLIKLLISSWISPNLKVNKFQNIKSEIKFEIFDSYQEKIIKNFYTFLNTENNKKETPLILACRQNNAQVVVFLFNLHAALLFTLHYEIRNLDIIKELFEENARFMISQQDIALFVFNVHAAVASRFVNWIQKQDNSKKQTVFYSN